MEREFCFTKRELQELLEDTILTYLDVSELKKYTPKKYAQLFTVKVMIEAVVAASELMKKEGE